MTRKLNIRRTIEHFKKTQYHKILFDAIVETKFHSQDHKKGHVLNKFKDFCNIISNFHRK